MSLSKSIDSLRTHVLWEQPSEQQYNPCLRLLQVGENPLYTAAKLGDAAAVKLLLSKAGVDINKVTHVRFIWWCRSGLG